MPHDLAVFGLRLHRRLRRQRGEDRVVSLDRFAPHHVNVVDAEQVVDRSAVAGALLVQLLLLLAPIGRVAHLFGV